MSRPDLLMTGPILPMIETQLEGPFTLHRLWQAADPEALITEVGPRVEAIATFGARRVDAALMDRLPALKIVANYGVGYDSIDAVEAGRRGIVVTNTPDVLTEEVADLALGLLLATLREIPQADRYLRAGKWLEKPYPLSRGTLRGRTVGIVGLGRIGRAIADRVAAFGVPVVYHTRTEKDHTPYRYYDNLVTMARDVDTMIVVTPGGPATKNLINAEVLLALGANGVLVNVARGSVVDEAGLIAALQKGTILSAGLDVFADEPRVPQALIDMDHIVLVPHIASASVHTRNAMGQLVVANLMAWLNGQPLLTPVPETPVG